MSIFTKIIQREIPAEIVYEDELCLAFKDIHPQAPIHLLLIPKKPIETLSDAKAEDLELLGHLMLKAPQILKEQGAENGFRVVINNGVEGGQEVYHLHLHLLAGRRLQWPPG
jgi:histidine triad (HIT) family protein